MAKGSRAQLRSASDAVAQQLRVISCSRKKASKMAALELASRIDKAASLPMQLR